MHWLRQIKYLWYYPTLIIVLLALGIFSTVYVNLKINEFEKKSLQKRSDTLSKAIDSSDLKFLSGNELDLANPEYVSLKDKLIAIKKVNPDVRFVYLTGKKDKQVFFIADSENPDSEGYSPPGQKYPEASADFFSVFETGNSILEGPVSDRWGSWISALSPLVDPETKKVSAVVGMDIEAGNYTKTVWLYSSLPLFIALILITLVAIGWVIKKEEEKMLEMKSEFVALASHDIRSPLSGVLWMIESMLSKPSENMTAEQKTSLSYIEGNCRNLLGTINDFLLITTLEAKGMAKLNKKACNLAELIRKTAADLDVSARQKSIAVRVNIPESIEIECDQEKMKRVFGNIIDNAIKYSKNNSQIEIGYQKEKDFHVVSIKDHGIGIPPQVKTSLFRGFFRAENAKEFSASGTGLGLYYAKKVIDLHGGKIWFDSAPGEGTTFHIALK